MKNKIILILVSAFLCFIIFKLTSKQESILLALGDSSCLASSPYGARTTSYNYHLSNYLNSSLNDNYCKYNLKVKDLTDYINNNRDSILTKLDKANYITLMIGFDELTAYKEVNNIIKKEFLDNYKELLNVLKDNTKAKIIVIGFYPNYFIKETEINKQIAIACRNLDITYINSETLAKKSSNFYNLRFHNLNRTGNLILFNIIRDKL